MPHFSFITFQYSVAKDVSSYLVVVYDVIVVIIVTVVASAVTVRVFLTAVSHIATVVLPRTDSTRFDVNST